MAYSINELRNLIQTSIFGRRLGLDKNDQLIGHTGLREPVTAATSDTTGTTISGYGWTSVDTSTDDTWLLAAPVPGAYKYLYTGSTSTGIRTIKRADATFAIQSSGNSTGTTIVAQGGGLTLQLFGISTALYAVVSRPTGFTSACSTEMAINGTT
jgi:hypothetical protein